MVIMDIKNMFKQYFFPTITDWKSQYLEYRESEFMKTDSMIWIFFNKKGSKIVYYSTIALSLFILGIFTYLSFLWNIISFLVFCYLDFLVIKFSMKYAAMINKDMTFYDIFLRDYDVD